ncbi:DNA polymerase beta-like protein [Hortaea werneckii]|nr:DNA polymerase beta-like protein [Hortaea werneckii]
MDADHTPSSQTFSSSPWPHTATLDLSSYPPIFVSATYFDTDDLHELEDALAEAGATLTYDAQEAKIIITKVLKPKRVQFDLRAKGMWTEEVKADQQLGKEDGPVKKRRKVSGAPENGRCQQDAILIEDESTESESETVARATRREKDGVDRARRRGESKTSESRKKSGVSVKSEQIINVVRLEWFEQSRQAGEILPLHNFLVLRCRRIERPLHAVPTTTGNAKNAILANPREAKTSQSISNAQAHHILARAKEDAIQPAKTADHFGKRQFGSKHQPPSSATSWSGGHSRDSKPAHLLHKTTTEDDENGISDLLPMPDWVKAGIKYACQRSTPRETPNKDFISQLKKIRTARLLTNDEIGVRAYSTSIAALSAYPHRIQSPREIIALPGCDAKIANLFVEATNTGTIQAVTDLETDPDLQILSHFYNIWGVGATTARDFYFSRGWKDLDDIVEYGWSSLSRVQQIGVKYYEEFLSPIPRAEVARIAGVIHDHAVKVRDPGIQSLLVGGYRRGKGECGDVDIIVSHPEERKTEDLITDLVSSLEEEEWITHTLLLSLQSTQRGQQTLPFRNSSSSSGGSSAGSHSGFDTLDKALVVWQDPVWEDEKPPSASGFGSTSASASASAYDEKKNQKQNKKKRNPNIHRRVDIIIAPWRSVGCAVLSWSGETTFQRDLRRYCKDVKGWKFDSSGIRQYGTGEVVDVEGLVEVKRGDDGGDGNGEGEGEDEDEDEGSAEYKGHGKGMEEAERRVFEAVGLEYRRPEERCTG